MLKQVNGRWALVSRKTQRPLAYYKGDGKPSDEWVAKQERRIQAFKHMSEASYVGNIGAMEMFKFFQQATPEQKKKLEQHIQSKKTKEAWNLIQNVTKVKLHKSLYEDVFGLSRALSHFTHAKNYDLAKKTLKDVMSKKQDSHKSLEYYASRIAQSYPGVDVRKLVKLYKEEVKPDILPKSGAGQDGTDELVKTYIKDTPGQSIKKFREYIK